MSVADVTVALSGAVYVAPPKAMPPTSATARLDSQWRSLGYLSSDGVTENDFADTSDITAWQDSQVVRKAVIRRGTTYRFEAIETNRLVIDLFYGGAASERPLWDDFYTANYEAQYGSLPPAARSPRELPPDGDIYTPTYLANYGRRNLLKQHTIGNSREHPISMVIDIVDRSTVIRRYIPNGVITERGDVPFNASDAIRYPFTVSALPNRDIDGTVMCFYNRVLNR